MNKALTEQGADDTPFVRGKRRGPLLGVHLSVAGGLENALHSAVQLGCDCVQIFVKNQRQWRAPPLRNDQIERFRAVQSATLVAPVIAHASYLLNLASPDDRARLGSVRALADELERCEALGVTGLVLHPGAHLDAGEDRITKIEDRKQNRGHRGAGRRLSNERSRDSEGTIEGSAIAAGIERIARSLDEVHRRCAGFRSQILLETTAGQGTSIGWRFEHLRGILDRVAEPDRLGVCLDTCHLFAAGYDFRTSETYAATIDELERAIGVAAVKCIHMNDSKRELGSRVDRHEHIGKGKIGKSGFAHFLNDPRFAGVPMILETPKGVDGRGTDLDKVNLKRLRSLGSVT